MIKQHFKSPYQYSKNNELQFYFSKKILDKIPKEMPAKILDIGCGDGKITMEISRYSSESLVIGTDVSEEMIKFASNKFDQQRNLFFLIMDAAKNIFYEQFDIVTSFNCLHWVKDQKSALNGIANSAKENAKIFLLLSHKRSLYHFILNEICTSIKWYKIFENYKKNKYFFSREEYQRMLENSGIHVAEILEEEMTYNFKSKTELKNFFFASSRHSQHIDSSLKEDFFNDFFNEFVSETQLINNFIPVKFWCLQIVGSKIPTKNKNQ